MTAVKIISDAYRQQTSFQSRNEAAEEWSDINIQINAGSKLLRDEFRSGFFPFKAKQIVDIILDEYGDGQQAVDVVFEGTDDEFRELAAICSSEDYAGRIKAERSSRALENARDILPDVIETFRRLELVFTDSSFQKGDIQQDLRKFSEASNETIPVCVIGNYSSGKSTFINALIGYELLPSSDEPTTAKVYRISQSLQSDRALISFQYNGTGVRLEFTDVTCNVRTECDSCDFLDKLRDLCESLNETPIKHKLHTILTFVNQEANATTDDSISDLISIETPFVRDNYAEMSLRQFVIFDTPGSNSASNEKHYQVLQDAMRNLSNGLPIFVCEYDTLDSTDNDRLYQEIHGLKELDNRFTMIIVNKADAAALSNDGKTDEGRRRILNLAIPRKLYSGGVYFLSSVMGLGAKNRGDFIDDHSAEIYEDQYNKYTNSESRFYKQLYHYDILPEQIRREYVKSAEAQSNLLYANSGLYSVEQAIVTFADKYAPYNKCRQSELFLNKAIETTKQAIEDAKNQQAETRDAVRANMERDKRMLIEQLERRRDELENNFNTEYPDKMTQHASEVEEIFKTSENKLKETEKRFLELQTSEHHVEDQKRQVDNAYKTLKDNLTGNFADVANRQSFDAVKRMGADLAADAHNVIKNFGELKNTQKIVDREASDDLLAQVRSQFADARNHVSQSLDRKSQEFWNDCTAQLRAELSAIVMGSEKLTEEKRMEINEIILRHQAMDFSDNLSQIFNRYKLQKFFGDGLDIRRIVQIYNNELQRWLKQVQTDLSGEHADGFHRWTQELLDDITANIEEYNPHLRSQNQAISDLEQRIAELEGKWQQINDERRHITELMSWMER